MGSPMFFSMGDIIIAKKPHPCGSNEWEIVRVGTDYKIKCRGCGHIVMLSYDKLRGITRRLKDNGI